MENQNLTKGDFVAPILLLKKNAAKNFIFSILVAEDSHFFVSTSDSKFSDVASVTQGKLY